MTKTELSNALSRLPREQIDEGEFSFYITDDIEVHYYNDYPILLYLTKKGYLYVLSSPDKTAEEHIKSVYLEGVNSGTLVFVLYLYYHSPLMLYKTYKGIMPIRVGEEFYKDFIECSDFIDYLDSPSLDDAIYHAFEAIYGALDDEYFMEDEQKC